MLALGLVLSTVGQNRARGRARQLKLESAAQAAKWMQEEMRRTEGVLTLDHAWDGVHQRFGSDLALRNDTDAWLCRTVLSAFRKLTPELIWDPVKKLWRSPRRADDRVEGARMI